MTHLKFRAECAHDVALLLQAIPTVSVIMRTTLPPDCEVELKTPLSLAEVKDVMASIPDGHVMRETVALKPEYTGERK